MDRELERKCRKTVDKINANIANLLNEPTLGLYRIQEHCRKNVPIVIDDRTAIINNTNDRLKSCLYDVEYACDTINCINDSSATFADIEESVEKSIELSKRIVEIKKQRQLTAEQKTK